METGAKELKDLQSLAYRKPRLSMVDALDEKVKDGAARAGVRVWQGALRVAASGFGKGAMWAIGAMLLAGAVFGITIPAATIEQGVAMGVGAAAHAMLSSWLGLLPVALGGVLGAVSDVRKRQNEISADMAEAQARDYALARQQAAQEPTPQPDMALPQAERSPQFIHMECNPTTVISHAQREEQRRVNTPSSPEVTP